VKKVCEFKYSSPDMERCEEQQVLEVTVCREIWKSMGEGRWLRMG
jgi:hypothetical protein